MKNKVQNASSRTLAQKLWTIGNLGLTLEEEADIVAFMKTLTDTLQVKELGPYKEAK